MGGRDITDSIGKPVGMRERIHSRVSIVVEDLDRAVADNVPCHPAER